MYACCQFGGEKTGTCPSEELCNPLSWQHTKRDWKWRAKQADSFSWLLQLIFCYWFYIMPDIILGLDCWNCFFIRDVSCVLWSVTNSAIVKPAFCTRWSAVSAWASLLHHCRHGSFKVSADVLNFEKRPPAKRMAAASRRPALGWPSLPTDCMFSCTCGFHHQQWNQQGTFWWSPPGSLYHTPGSAWKAL